MPVPCSLIISTYNWAAALRVCLQSVMKQKRLPDEVIVADDGSGDETRRVITEFQGLFPVPLLHVWHEDRGFRKTQILNTALKQSSSEYIVQIDGDVVLHPFFIHDHLELAEKGTFVRGTRARLTAGITSAVLSSKNIRLTALSQGVYNRLNAIRLPVWRELGSRKKRSSKSVRGSNLAFWKDDFIKVNGYNNDLQGWGHEDEELAARFINNNILKKIVKLAAVQFHLDHVEKSRENEAFHARVVEDTVTKNIKTCVNGYSCN